MFKPYQKVWIECIVESWQNMPKSTVEVTIQSISNTTHTFRAHYDDLLFDVYHEKNFIPALIHNPIDTESNRIPIIVFDVLSKTRIYYPVHKDAVKPRHTSYRHESELSLYVKESDRIPPLSFTIIWSEEDNCYLASVNRYTMLKTHGSTPIKALKELCFLLNNE